MSDTEKPSQKKIVKKIVGLLKEVSTIGVVSDFLRSKSLHHSAGSWDDLLNQRILPAFEEKKLHVDELLTLLSESEESGNQHIYLYSISKDSASEILDSNRIKRVIDELDLGEMPKLLEKPSEPTISDVRPTANNTELVVKVISQSFRKKTILDDKAKRSQDQGGGYVQTIKVEYIPQRIVNLVKVHADGFIEARIQSQSGSSQQYQKELGRLWKLVNPLVPLDKINMYSLAKAKDKLWNNREELSEIIRYTSYTLKNDIGTSLKASASGKNSSLLGDSGAKDSLDKFLNSDGFCDQSNIWFKEKEGLLSSDVHVLIEGALNEYRLPKHCSKLDYEYVLSKIRKFSR